NQASYVIESVENGGSASRTERGNNPTGSTSSEKKEKLNLSRLSKRSLLTAFLICLANFCGGCIYSIPSPFFPAVAARKGMSESLTGFLFSSSELISFACSILFGKYLMHIGPKFLYVSSIYLSGVSSILFGLSENSSPGAIFISLTFICRSIDAATFPAVFNSGFVIMSSEFPSHVSTIFGITETSMSLGLMAGPSVGGVLNQIGGPSMPFYVIGGLMLLVGLTVFMFLPPPQEIEEKKQSSFFTLLSSSLVWVALLVTLTLGVGNSFLWPVFSIHLEQFHLSSSLIGLMFIIVPGLYGLTMTVSGYLLDKKDVKKVVTVYGSFICGLSLLLLGPTPLLPFLPVKLWVIIVGLFVYGLHYGPVVIATMRCTIAGAGELGFETNLEVYALVAGVYNAAYFLGTFIGPTMSGTLVETIGFRWASTCMTGLFLLAAVCSLFYFSIQRLRKGWKKAADLTSQKGH
ncbi:unnamed protein product, partial [Candidula unifasciata]